MWSFWDPSSCLSSKDWRKLLLGGLGLYQLFPGLSQKSRMLLDDGVWIGALFSVNFLVQPAWLKTRKAASVTLLVLWLRARFQGCAPHEERADEAALFLRPFELGASVQAESFPTKNDRPTPRCRKYPNPHLLFRSPGRGKAYYGTPEMCGSKKCSKNRQALTKLLVVNTALVRPLSTSTFWRSLDATQPAGASCWIFCRESNCQQCSWLATGAALLVKPKQGSGFRSFKGGIPKLQFEVRSCQKRTSLPGIEAFSREFSERNICRT